MEGSLLDLGKPIGDAISRIQFAPRSNNLLISSWDSFLRLYDVDGSAVRYEALSEGALLDCCFVDESSALSASSDGCIQRYDLFSGTRTFVGKHDDVVKYVEYSEQTGQVITAGMDKKFMFWDIKSGNVVCIKNVDSEVWSLSISGSNLLAVIGRKVYVYDLRKLNGPVQSKDSSLKYQLQCISAFPSREGYAIGSADGCVELKYFNISEDSDKGYAFLCHPKLQDRWSHSTVNDIKFHPRDDTFVTGDNDGHAVIWNAINKKKIIEVFGSSDNRNKHLIIQIVKQPIKLTKSKDTCSQSFEACHEYLIMDYPILKLDMEEVDGIMHNSRCILREMSKLCTYAKKTS